MTSTERKMRQYLDKAIGPQVVGGTYRCGYWGKTYTVLAIFTGPRGTGPIVWSEWSMTVRWSDGRETTHCTHWDYRRDSVIS
jgi:hypothetical protein